MHTLPSTATLPVYIKNLFDSYDRKELLYHNYHHTCLVVIRTKEIAAHYTLDSRSFFILESAAWFHDTGQLTGDMSVHEERSVQFMREYFSDKTNDGSLLDDIASCILATKMPANPSGLLQKIICDADTFHLGTKDFQQLDPLVWQELELRLHKPVADQPEKSLAFLQQHKFYTAYCQQVLSSGKQKNIVFLEERIHDKTSG